MEYTQHLSIDRNILGKDYVVGDLHGCFTKLKEAMETVNFNTDVDRLFCVGDLVDRGPDSLSCLTLLKEPWFYSVLGNHDQFFVEGILESKNIWLWVSNGGDWAEHIHKDTLVMYANLAKKLPISITIDNKIGICHADPPAESNVSWSTYSNSINTIKNRLWGRHSLSHGIITSYNDIEYSYHGHTPVERPTTLGQARFVDTGACFGFQLTIEEIKY